MRTISSMYFCTSPKLHRPSRVIDLCGTVYCSTAGGQNKEEVGRLAAALEQGAFRSLVRPAVEFQGSGLGNISDARFPCQALPGTPVRARIKQSSSAAVSTSRYTVTHRLRRRCFVFNCAECYGPQPNCDSNRTNLQSDNVGGTTDLSCNRNMRERGICAYTRLYYQESMQ